MKVKELMQVVTSATVIHAWKNRTASETDGEYIGSFGVLREFVEQFGDYDVIGIYPEKKDYLYVSIKVKSKTIKTNFGMENDYPILNGERSTMILEKMQWVCDDGDMYEHLEGDHRMYQRLVEKGYSTITFYRRPTRVRGYYHIIAYCKY